MSDYTEYVYNSADSGHAHGYLLDPVLKIVREVSPSRVFEIGAGNGAIASKIAELGCEVCGIEPSKSGVMQCQTREPRVSVEQGSAYDDLAAKFGRFPMVISLEVIEHLYAPRLFAQRAFELLEPGGKLLVSTPYHGYAKNLALALSGRMDAHFTALWEGGHIKFWSPKTLSTLLRTAGFQVRGFHYAGRSRMFAKSILVLAERTA